MDLPLLGHSEHPRVVESEEDLPEAKRKMLAMQNDHPETVISKEQAQGNALMICGGEDGVWQSCLFEVEKLESKSFIGFTGLSEPTFLPEVMPAVEIGWRLAREHWGRGYATEAAKASLEFGLRDLGLPAIVSIFQIENKASRNVIEKLGMRFDRQTLDPTCNRLVEVYRISAR